MGKDCLNCAHSSNDYWPNPKDSPCTNCKQVVFTNWKPKESPAWKEYVDTKVKEQMQNLYKAFEAVPHNCQQAMFIRKEDVVPKTCYRCGLGPCPYNISIKGLNL